MKHPNLETKDIASVISILRSGELSMFRGTPEGQAGGQWVQALETITKAYFGTKYAVAFNSATSALHASCMALNTDAIVSPYTFVASASCVLMAGNKPLFSDIDEDTFCINEPTDKLVIPVHLMGHPADMSLFTGKVIEDAAQAIGAEYYGQKVGTIGDCGIFSFNQSKTISTGEGGMLITNDDWIYRVARAMRNHGEVSDPDLKMVGYNYRMCEVEAALAFKQMQRLDDMNKKRIELTSYMTRKLNTIKGLTPPILKPNCKSVFYTYGVKFDANYFGYHRNVFQDRLIKNGLYFGKGYVKPLVHLPIFEPYYRDVPVADRMWKDELMVTDILRPPLGFNDIDGMVEIIKRTIHG